MTACPDDLRRLYKAHRVIPFIGAGASMSVRWGSGSNPKSGPSWEEMVNQAARLLGVDEPKLLRLRGTDLQIREYFKIYKGNLAELTNWLSLQFSSATDDDILKSDIYSELALLENCSLFYTTNYDDFIERALRKSQRNVHTVSSEHSISHDRTSMEVVKFHGDFNTPEQMVLKAYPCASGAINILAGDRAKTAPSHRMWSAPEPEG